TAPPAWWRRWRPPAWSPHPSTTATARSWRRHRPSHGAGEKAGIGCRNGAGRDPSATPGALVSRPDPDAPAVRPRPDALRWHRGGQRGGAAAGRVRCRSRPAFAALDGCDAVSAWSCKTCATYAAEDVWMIRNCCWLLIALVALAGVAHAGAREQLDRFTGGLHGLEGEFTQQVLEEAGRERESSSGRVAP